MAVENLSPANPVMLDNVDDLIKLSYLNEPSVLHNLKQRYSHDMIYVRTFMDGLWLSSNTTCPH